MAIVIIALVMILALGVATCFFGRSLLHMLLSVGAFLLVFGVIISIFDFSILGIVIAIILGIIAGILAVKLYSLQFVIFGAIIGVSIGTYLSSMLGIENPIFLIIAVSVLCAVLGGMLKNTLIITGSAVCGALYIGQVLIFFITNIYDLGSFAKGNLANTISTTLDYLSGAFMTEYALYILIIATIFSVLGIIAQRKRL